MTQRQMELRELMQRHGLTYADVATMLDVKQKRVEAWLADREAASARNMPEVYLSVLRMKLSRRKTRK